MSFGSIRAEFGGSCFSHPYWARRWGYRHTTTDVGEFSGHWQLVEDLYGVGRITKCTFDLEFVTHNVGHNWCVPKNTATSSGWGAWVVWGGKQNRIINNNRVFKSLKDHFSKSVRALAFTKPNFVVVTKRDFPKVFKGPFEHAFSISNVKAGFEKSGIFPFNPDAIATAKM